MEQQQVLTYCLAEEQHVESHNTETMKRIFVITLLSLIGMLAIGQVKVRLLPSATGAELVDQIARDKAQAALDTLELLKIRYEEELGEINDQIIITNAIVESTNDLILRYKLGLGGDPNDSVPPASPPVAPSTLTATVAAYTQINLNWTDNSDNESSFKIERAPGGTTNFTEIGSVGAGVTTFASTGLTASTSYSYRVRASNAIGNSAYTNVVTATTSAAPVTIPTAPSSLTGTAISSSQINLSWTDNSNNESSFRIERAPGGTTNFAEIGSVAAGVRTYSNTGLSASTSYAYRVRAQNTAGNSGYTNVFTTTTLAPAVNDTAIILFSQNFDHLPVGRIDDAAEVAQWKKDWLYPTSANHALGYGDIVENGSPTNKACKIPYPAGTYTLAEHGVEWDTDLPSKHTDIYLAYKIKFSSGFATHGEYGGKLPGIKAGGISAGVVPTNGVMVRVLHKGNTPKTYQYYATMYNSGPPDYQYSDPSPIAGKGYYGVGSYFYDPWYSSYSLNDPATSVPKIRFTANVWFDVKIHVKLNSFTGSTANADGYSEVFINNKRAYRKNNVIFRKRSDLAFDQLNFAFHLSGGTEANNSPVADESITIDNVVVYVKK